MKYSGKIKILMEYGASHTRLLHLASKQSDIENLSYKFTDIPFRFSHSDEARRRFWFALDTKDPKKVKLPDSKLMAHVVIEDFLMNWFLIPNLSSFENTSAAMSWFRDIVEKFDTTEPETADLWEYQRIARQGRSELSSSDPLPELRSGLATKLREKGVAERYIQAGLASSVKSPEYALSFYLPPQFKSKRIEVA